MDTVIVMSTSLTGEQVSPWLYFLAGTLVPTLSFWFLSRSNKYNRNSLSKDDYDWESDNDDDDDDDRQPFASKATAAGTSCKEWGSKDAPYKMVLCVNQSLSMGKGKIAAQCCHAAVGAYKRAIRNCPNAVMWWERTGCAKIAVKCPTEQEMQEIYQNARLKDIPLYLVEDAGRTQIAAGSRTVLGLGPAPVHAFENVTSHLKLM